MTPQQQLDELKQAVERVETDYINGWINHEHGMYKGFEQAMLNDLRTILNGCNKLIKEIENG